MLFQWDLGGQPPAQIASTFLTPRKLHPETARFAQDLFEGAVAESGALDALVRKHSQHWRLERIAAVDRNILRLALYELFHLPQNPPAVVVNEALELARRFSTEDSVEFVNGVLEGIRNATSPTSE